MTTTMMMATVMMVMVMIMVMSLYTHCRLVYLRSVGNDIED